MKTKWNWKLAYPNQMVLSLRWGIKIVQIRELRGKCGLNIFPRGLRHCLGPCCVDYTREIKIILPNILRLVCFFSLHRRKKFEVYTASEESRPCILFKHGLNSFIPRFQIVLPRCLGSLDLLPFKALSKFKFGNGNWPEFNGWYFWKLQSRFLHFFLPLVIYFFSVLTGKLSHAGEILSPENECQLAVKTDLVYLMIYK